MRGFAKKNKNRQFIYRLFAWLKSLRVGCLLRRKVHQFVIVCILVKLGLSHVMHEWILASGIKLKTNVKFDSVCKTKKNIYLSIQIIILKNLKYNATLSNDNTTVTSFCHFLLRSIDICLIVIHIPFWYVWFQNKL